MLDPRLLANITLIAAPTLMFLAASMVLLLVTGPSKAGAGRARHIEIRGGETLQGGFAAFGKLDMPRR